MEAVPGNIEGNAMSDESLQSLREMYKNLKELFPPAPPTLPAGQNLSAAKNPAVMAAQMQMMKQAQAQQLQLQQQQQQQQAHQQQHQQQMQGTVGTTTG